MRLLATRGQMIGLLPRDAVAAEIGVSRGKFTAEIMAANRPRKLHLVDVWASERYTDALRQRVEQTYAAEIAADSVEINRGYSIEVGRTFPDAYFDWIYIDTDHSYPTTRDELAVYESKMKPGGIIAGHDYVMGNWRGSLKFGVIEAVHEFCLARSWELLLSRPSRRRTRASRSGRSAARDSARRRRAQSDVDGITRSTRAARASLTLATSGVAASSTRRRAADSTASRAVPRSHRRMAWATCRSPVPHIDDGYALDEAAPDEGVELREDPIGTCARAWPELRRASPITRRSTVRGSACSIVHTSSSGRRQRRLSPVPDAVSTVASSSRVHSTEGAGTSVQWMGTMVESSGLGRVASAGGTPARRPKAAHGPAGSVHKSLITDT